MQEVKGYSDSCREELEEEEESSEIREEISNSKILYPFSSPLSSSLHVNFPHHHNPWLGMMLHDHHHHHHHHHQYSPEATESHNSSSGLGLHHQDASASASNFTVHRKLDFMDLSLGGNKDEEANFHGASSSGHGSSSSNHNDPIEKEPMFDKVVTPSDVGKLNRLVIPKQHAERYFPLDSSTNEKGLLLNFEDRNGKLWRFRYSYWNSSQSYVMTKGWSRFVKEKKLDAGDIVSFQRGAGELYRHRLYIDWRRRPDHQVSDPTTLITPLFLPNQPSLSQYSIRWGGRLYSVPSPEATARHHHHHEHLPQVNYNNMYPFQQNNRYYHPQYNSGSHHQSFNEPNLGSGSLYYLRSTPSTGDQNLPGQQGGRSIAPMIIDSVPVAHHLHQHGMSSTCRTPTAGKRLRLFGVNMECGSSPAEETQCRLLSSTSAMANSLPSSSLPPFQFLRAPHEDPLSSSSSRRFADQKGETSVLFDLDRSFQYRQ